MNLWFSTILESFPNLKSLRWECDIKYEKMHLNQMNQVSFSSVPVPECLHSSLEFVYFKVPFSGFTVEMELVRTHQSSRNSLYIFLMIVYKKITCSDSPEPPSNVK
ncbi:unnamed protein product, partial [Thlaspi arvense]